MQVQTIQYPLYLKNEQRNTSSYQSTICYADLLVESQIITSSHLFIYLFVCSFIYSFSHYSFHSVSRVCHHPLESLAITGICAVLKENFPVLLTTVEQCPPLHIRYHMLDMDVDLDLPA
jgi:hypothetical protein